MDNHGDVFVYWGSHGADKRGQYWEPPGHEYIISLCKGYIKISCSNWVGHQQYLEAAGMCQEFTQVVNISLCNAHVVKGEVGGECLSSTSAHKPYTTYIFKCPFWLLLNLHISIDI